MRSTLDLREDIRSLTEFKRNTTRLVSRMRATGRPLVLTVNGKAELVVQDAGSYQDVMERLTAIEGIRKGLDQLHRGQGRSPARFFNRMRRRYGIPR